MLNNAFIDDAILEFREYKKMGEGALAQVSDQDFFKLIDPDANNIALIVKHMAGNMRSRWTDFLTTDGEKTNRNRDSEFYEEKKDTKASLMKHWEEGWKLVFNAIGPLREKDLGRTVNIRGEEHTVLQAINRQLTHYSYHVGQIVFLAKHFAGPKWKSLSIPKNKSKESEVSKRGKILKMVTTKKTAKNRK